MYTKEELQYVSLAKKFNAELAEIDAKVQELELRKEHLKALLNGLVDIEPEPEAKPEPKEPIARRPEKTENNNAQRAKLDKALVTLLEASEGLSRKQINAALQRSWSPWDIDKSLKRCKSKDLIVREGETVNAKWYAAEVS